MASGTKKSAVSDSLKSNDIAPLSKNDIISIIKQCSKHGVSSLKIQGLELELTSETQHPMPYAPLKKDVEDETPYEEEPDYTTLLIEHPEEYERLVAQEESHSNAQTIEDR